MHLTSRDATVIPARDGLADVCSSESALRFGGVKPQWRVLVTLPPLGDTVVWLAGSQGRGGRARRPMYASSAVDWAGPTMFMDRVGLQANTYESASDGAPPKNAALH